MPLTRIRTDDLLSGSVAGGTLNATSITGQSAATSADDNDLILIYDDGASALRKMTRANFTAGLSTTLSGAYDAGRIITASNGPIEVQRTSNTNAATELLRLVVSGNVNGFNAGPRLSFHVPFSDEARVGATIDGIKNQTSENNSTTELRFNTSENNQTLVHKVTIGPQGLGVAGSSATVPNLGGGPHAFFVAASGEDNALNVKNVNGNVGIGVLSPLVPLHVKRSDTGVTAQISAQQGSTGDAGYFLSIPNASYMMGIDNDDSDKFKIAYGNAADNAVLATNPRLTINTSGKVGINKSDPEALLDIVDTSITAEDGFDAPANYHMFIEGSTTTNDYAGIGIGTSNDVGAAILFQDKGSYAKGDLVFMTKVSTSNGVAPVERMRIAASGYVAIGSGSTISYPLTLEKSNAAGYVSRFYNSYNGAAGGLWIKAGNTTSTSSPQPFIVQSYNGTNQFYVRQDGAYFHRAGAISTEDSKRDVSEMSESAVDLLRDIRIVTYNYHEDTEDRVKRIGFIADDTTNQPAIDPRLTNGGAGFDIQTLVGTLIKAVQELSSSINTLQSGD